MKNKASDAALLARVKNYRCLRCNGDLGGREVWCRNCDREITRKARPMVLSHDQFFSMVRSMIQWLEQHP